MVSVICCVDTLVQHAETFQSAEGETERRLVFPIFHIVRWQSVYWFSWRTLRTQVPVGPILPSPADPCTVRATTTASSSMLFVTGPQVVIFTGSDWLLLKIMR
jgi:hypothetical protein